MLYLEEKKTGTGILLLLGLVLWTKKNVFWLDDCLIALKFSKNAPISKLFSFLIYDFSLQSYVLCVYARDMHL